MKNYKHILEAINRGIKLAIDDYEDIENNEPISSNQDIVGNDDNIKKIVDFYKPFVDLGLPSGTLWAKYNLGCDWNKLINDPNQSKPNDWYGNYYAWGETNPNKNEYNRLNYKFSELYIKYNKDDRLTELQPEDDAAYQVNHRMKMPTKEQCEELINNTKSYWKENYLEIQGLNGVIFEGKNGNRLFLPASGYYDEDTQKHVGESGDYWTSNGGDWITCYAYKLFFTGNARRLYRLYTDNMDDRYQGCTIRPVIKK